MQKYKVVIIGSGIAGMTSAIYLKRGGIDPLIIENSAPGGTLNLIPSIENYPGYSQISGPDLGMNIYNQVNALKIAYLFRHISKIDLVKKVIDDDITFDYLIIATGKKPRLLNLDNEDKFIGKGISTCALCDGHFYKNQNVIVIGGANSALTESLYLAGLCKKVTIICRKSNLKGEKYLIDKVQGNKKIKIIYSSNVIKYNIKDEKIVGVTLDNNQKVKADGIFLAIGSSPNSELFDVKKDNGFVVVDHNYQTSQNNVYAIGDVIKKEVYQLTTAIGEASYVASMIIKKER